MKPRVIILGGCGFIGRNLVDHLVLGDLAAEVCVVDKVPPQTAWLSETHKASFDDPRVQFRSANLINPDSCRASFARDDDATWDWAINCAGETRAGQPDSVYEEGIYHLSLSCSRQAAQAKVGAYLEFSCCMASSKKVALKEKDPRDPVTRVAKWKQRVEEELALLEGLRCVVFRPAIVYGPADRSGLMPVLMLGAIYKHLGETLKLLWSRDVHMNTVHVRDVCRAVVHALSRPAASHPGPEVFHIVDESRSTQGSVCDAVAAIFGIEHVYWGSAVSRLAKSDLKAVAEDVNDKHLPVWATLCSDDGVSNTPLSPYLTAEALGKQHVHLDGAKLKALGFQYSVPKLTPDALLEALQEHVNMNLFPRSCLS